MIIAPVKNTDEKDMTPLDIIEAAAWRVAAEPTPARMDQFLEVVLSQVPEIGTQGGPQRNADAAPALSVVSLAESVKLPEVISESRQAVPGAANGKSAECSSASASEMRTCRKCGKDKRADDFPADKTAPSGRRAQCRSCVALRRAELKEQKRRASGAPAL